MQNFRGGRGAACLTCSASHGQQSSSSIAREQIRGPRKGDKE